jgi:bifunctional enzyme CysN/CysC
MDIHEYLHQHERKSLLRFLTCGSVDDGKSTLIGRLLYDCKMVYEDQLSALKSASVKHGTTGDDFDPALLTDGLKAEREQGITIDVAYRYFSTQKRKFIIADTPGHEQYTRNMVTGASNCELAIILIDARKGVLIQSKRHSFLVSLLGIQNVVVAVNKMDLVDYSQQVYEEICQQYLHFTAKLKIPHIEFVPMSALKGANVVHEADQEMPWYHGSTLLHILENIPLTTAQNLIDFRLPIQYVLRPHLDFRGFSGSVASGSIRCGEEVLALPSMQRAHVKEILVSGCDAQETFAGQATVLTLDKEIDLSRGDMLVRPNNRPRIGRTFEAMLVWMGAQDLSLSASYILKHNTTQTLGKVNQIKYQIDINTLHRSQSPGLALNEIARVHIELNREICFDPYQTHKATGALVMIDRITHDTVGALMILQHLDHDVTINHMETDHPLSTKERTETLGYSALRIQAPDLLYKLERMLLTRNIMTYAERAHDHDLCDQSLARAGVVYLCTSGICDLSVSMKGSEYILQSEQDSLTLDNDTDLLDAIVYQLRRSTSKK